MLSFNLKQKGDFSSRLVLSNLLTLLLIYIFSFCKVLNEKKIYTNDNIYISGIVGSIAISLDPKLG